MKSLFLETETLHPSFDSISFDFGLFDTFEQTDNVSGGHEMSPMDILINEAKQSYNCPMKEDYKPVYPHCLYNHENLATKWCHTWMSRETTPKIQEVKHF